MTHRTRLPSSASIALPDTGARLTAPSAQRNAPAIAAVLAQHGPQSGRALEIASGTGQHVVAFAAALPGLTWQPTEIDATRRTSIDAWAEAHNILPAIPLDATAPEWGVRHAGQDLIVLVNLLHLISDAEAQILLREVAAALAPGALFAVYGPFLQGGCTVSQADADFDASLRANDPEIGYKDVDDVLHWMDYAGLCPEPPIDMPSNNLMLLARQAL
ncbi:DUF938 domain-containing protein [Roseovarius sp. M141]|uniref:DUF938 domain-containing protein n=1 Tax=Roseovarius sp. M141 TaxID=2583806 RepID=UPI0020CD359C|nr:DUF938 domain-containing protein [Roseovarius sp. M141]MCQ0093562.1 DUF938 domain-containing protein [Roseovarius sp. M141]